jgi:hypothetical protein
VLRLKSESISTCGITDEPSLDETALEMSFSHRKQWCKNGLRQSKIFLSDGSRKENWTKCAENQGDFI